MGSIPAYEVFAVWWSLDMTGCTWIKRSSGKAGDCACDLNRLPNCHCTDLMCFFLTVKGYRCFSRSAWIWENKWELIQVTTQEGTRRGWGWRGKRETWQRDGQWYSPVCEVGQRRCGWKKWQQPPSDKHLVWYEDWRGSREAGASIACWREEIHGLHMWRIQR